MPNHDKFSLAKFLNSLFQKLKPKILQDQHRPAHIPPVAPDCGWNHGRPKESSAMKESTTKKNNSDLKNPLPDKIPDIVWNDLLYSEKVQIIDAVKLRYKITYFHTERRLEREKSLADTDVIEIKGYDSENEQKSSKYIYSRIYSRATSERGITRLDNPVMDIIPCDIWNNLPDVLKEDIVEGNNYYKKYKGDYDFDVNYYPDENTIIIRQGVFMGLSYKEIYDAKRGVGISGTVHHGL